MARQSWLTTQANILGEELALIGLTVPAPRLEELLAERVQHVAAQMRFSERTARQYFTHDSRRRLARELALAPQLGAGCAELRHRQLLRRLPVAVRVAILYARTG